MGMGDKENETETAIEIERKSSKQNGFAYKIRINKTCRTMLSVIKIRTGLLSGYGLQA